MTIPLAMKFEGRKFVWDGKLYETEAQAHQVLEEYKKAGFDAQLSKDTDKWLVYSRRVASVQKEG